MEEMCGNVLTIIILYEKIYFDFVPFGGDVPDGWCSDMDGASGAW